MDNVLDSSTLTVPQRNRNTVDCRFVSARAAASPALTVSGTQGRAMEPQDKRAPKVVRLLNTDIIKQRDSAERHRQGGRGMFAAFVHAPSPPCTFAA
jgi:hypothetical protein